AEAADLIAEALGGSGTVALIPYIAGASTSNERERGFKGQLARHEGLRLVATQYSESDYEKAMSVTEDILTANPNLDAIFAANEPSVLGAAQALRSRGVEGDVVLVGFDASPRQVEGIRDGSIYALVVQNPYRMGYEGVMQAYAALQGEEVPERIDSGSMIVTRDNVDDFERSNTR
ncbi:MAG TPA: substrate-binding domain-containing protein, partial [Rhodothermales bacterium]